MIKNGIKIFAVVILIIALSCSFKEPVLPSWFLPVNIPLSDQTFKLSEIINESSIVAQGQDSLLFISIEDSIEPVRLSDLYVEPQSDTASINVGSIRLDSLKDLTTEFINLRTLLPELSLFVGDTVTIPDTTLQFLSLQVESDDYKRIHVTSGSVTLRLINNLPVPLGPNTAAELLNDSLNTSVIDITIPGIISPGQTGTGSGEIPPGGLWIYSKLRVEYDLPISGPTTVFVTDSLLDSSGFSIEVDFENFEADEVVAKLQGQQFSDVKKIEIENESKLRMGKVAKGAVHIDFMNNLDLDSKVIFTLPNITDQGIPFTDSVEIESHLTSSKDVVVDGFEVSNPANPGEFIDSLEVDFTVYTKSPSGFVHLTSNDSISSFIQTDTLYLEYFQGFFAMDTLEVSEFSEDNIADYGDFTGGIELQNVALDINLTSGILVEDLSVDLELTGYHEDENGHITDSSTFNYSAQNFNTFTDPDIHIPLSGQDVVDFVNILPTSIKGTATFVVQGEAEIHQDSTVSGNYLFETPLRLQITGRDTIGGPVTTFIEEGDKNFYEGITDTLSNDVRDRGDDFQSGELQLDLTNHTPLQVSIRMRVSGDLSRPDSAFFVAPLNDSLEFEKSKTMAAGSVDPITGFVSIPQTSNVSLELTREQIQILANPPYKVGYELTIFPSQGVVALRSTDFVKALGLAKVIVKVEDK